MLRATRESSGISLDEVSQDIEIPVLYLEQIEEGAIGSFEDIFELKQMIIDYAKYLGVSTDSVIAKFNEYMFEYTSKIPMDEIEKAIKEQMKEKEDEEKIQSPYTKVYPKEKTMPYIITGIVIVLLVIIAVVWSVRQITIDNNGSNIIGYYEIGE
jgi:cytoskeletal protein RodZ